MSYCYIIPKDNQPFLQLLNGIQISSHTRQIISASTILKIEVDLTKRGWKIFLQVSESLPVDQYQIVSSILAEKYNLTNVMFEEVLPKSFSEYLIHSWEDFVSKISSVALGTRHLLLHTSWTFENEILSLEVASPLAATIMEERGVVHAIQKIASEEFSFQCQVNLIVSQISVEESCSEEEYLTPEYLEALEDSHSEEKEKVTETPMLIMGRKIKDPPVPIGTIQEESRNIVLAGEIVSTNSRVLRSGRLLFSFEVVDTSDGITGKIFFDTQEALDKIEKELTPGMNTLIKGSIQFDRFANELILFPDSIVRTEKSSERMDLASETRIELHAHTRMSNMDAVVSAKELVKTAAKWKHSAIAITDHGVVQAFPEAAEEAERHNIKIIYGMEGYLFDDNINQSYHVIILAKNPIGLRNLYRLVSISHLKYLHRTPKIPRKVLAEHRDGLIIGSACEAGELIKSIVEKADDSELETIARFYDYLEIQPTGNNAFLVREGRVLDVYGLQDINRKVYDLGQQLDLPVVATGDVHFLHPQDEIYRRILMTGKGFSDADYQPPLYLHTTEEMLLEFQYLGNKIAEEVVIHNPKKIADQIEKFKPIPDELYSPQIPGADDAIRNMSYEKAEFLYGSPLPDLVAERLTYELNSIINNGFAVLYLIAHKLVKKSLDDGYLVGSRGSVGSSFVATMTSITEVNPLPPHWRCTKCKYSQFIVDGSYGSGFDLPDANCPQCQTKMVKDGHDIPFAVFMGFHGDKVPDIDLNFSGDYQPVAHKYTEELFGKDSVFRAGTIATIADKTAFGFVKNYFTDKGLPVRNPYINKVVSGCTGVKRTTGQHPGGIMVVPRDMDVHYFTPIQYPADDKNSSTITTHFDYHSISSRLVKLDILGHDDPTVIKMLESLTGIDAKTIPFDDPQTLSLFYSTNAIGLTPQQISSPVATFAIPEFGTKFVRQMLEDTTPRKFSELVRISGFSHGTDVWLNNAQELIKNGIAKLGEAISARDDIMVYLIQKGVPPQLAFKTMENVRKGKGIKSEDVEKLKDHAVPDWYIESCQKIKYMFPKAHAVAYVMMAFRIAYFKIYYPLAFYAAYFTVRATEFDAEALIKGPEKVQELLKEFEEKGNQLTAKEKGLQTIAEVVLEMNLRKFHFLPIDLYQSDASKFLIVNDSLLPPLGSLQGVGGAAAQNIVQAREERPFLSIEDLKTRGKVSKTVIEVLQAQGCLEGLPEDDQIMLFA